MLSKSPTASVLITLTIICAMSGCGGGDDDNGSVESVDVPSPPTAEPASGEPSSQGGGGAGGTSANHDAGALGPISVPCLSKAQREALEVTGFEFHDGITPPRIDGRYLADSLTILFDEETGFEDDGTADAGASGLGFEATTEVFSYYYGFELDEATPALTFRYQATGDYYHQDDGVGPASLTGEGNCFTVCAKTESYSGDCDYKARQVVSACITDAGLTEFEHAYLLASKSPSCSRLLRVGSRRLMGETDGLAKPE
ncbi:MAG: hypothetical protein ACOC1F_06790 [Myxococcota bacterium]